MSVHRNIVEVSVRNGTHKESRIGVAFYTQGDQNLRLAQVENEELWSSLHADASQTTEVEVVMRRREMGRTGVEVLATAFWNFMSGALTYVSSEAVR